MRFRRDNAQALFDNARQFAEEHQLNQIAFEIEAERKKEATTNSNPPAVEPTGELRQIAEVLEHLRDRASAE
jgi:hypothetical protein